MENKFDIKITGLYVKLYINDTLYVMFNQVEFKGLQSWRMGKNWFVIEIYIKDLTITLEFDSKEKWEAILKLLDENL